MKKVYDMSIKQYLANIDIGEIVEYKGPYTWSSVRSVGTKMKTDFGVLFLFNTAEGKRYIIRVR